MLEQAKITKLATQLQDAIDTIVSILSQQECDLARISTPNENGQRCMIVVTTATHTTEKLRRVMQVLLSEDLESIGMAVIPTKK